MMFLHPYILWLLPLAAAAIVLYIIFRRRQTIVAWGATFILRLALASGRRQSLWKQIVIIALRTIFLLLLLLAFARPLRVWTQAQATSAFPHGPGALHRVILLDNTLSMNAQHGIQTRFDAARAALAALLVDMRPGDTCHIIPLCPWEPGGRIIPQPVSVPIAPRKIQSLAQKMKPVSGDMDFSAALRAATDILRESAAATRQLIVISDLARVDHPVIQDYDVFREMLASLNTRCATLNLGARACINVAAEDVTAGTEVLMKNQPSSVYATLMNYSEQGSPETRVRFYVDGQLLSQQACPLATGQRRTIAFPVTLGEGVHQLVVGLDKDSYEFDNQVKRFVRVEGTLRVLLVASNQDQQEGFESDTAFIDRALAAGTAAPFRLDVKKVRENALNPGALKACDVAIFCGLTKLSTPLLDELAGFVRRGGGLILALGPWISATEFNSAFGTFLPVLLDAPYQPVFNVERFTTIQPLNIPALMLREFETGDNGEISRARIYNYFGLKRPIAAPLTEANPGTTTLLQLATSDPLLIMHPFGKGAVFLWTSTIGGAWNSLPVCQAYLPFLYRLANLAGSFHGLPRNLKPGDPIIAELRPTDGKTYLTTPDAKLIEGSVTSNGPQRFIRIEGLTAPGEYDLQDEKGKSLALFSMAMPLKESDLRMLDEREIQLYCASLGMSLAVDVAGLRKALWRPGDGTEWAGWLLMTLVGLLALDAMLTKRWFS